MGRTVDQEVHAAFVEFRAKEDDKVSSGVHEIRISCTWVFWVLNTQGSKQSVPFDLKAVSTDKPRSVFRCNAFIASRSAPKTRRVRNSTC